MHIFIVGPMASGKSTIGKKLAKTLGVDFIDIDKEIERKAGVEISRIFELEGEEGFREREKKTLKELSGGNDSVISTGGGAVLRIENRELMKSKGKVIYLETPVELQLERTLKDKIRPLLSKGNKEETLRSLKKQRDPLYQEIANITIKQNNKNYYQILKEIIKNLNVN
tara:strand:+ start:458 stop:964 length:507 start_codon:yes stop_codon:yes gene_type:complete